ncbi:polycomb protein suz12-B isoform X2 [Bacillus rossius redtenbacheri]
MKSPIFLNRTLSYMRQRMSRSHKGRQGFKVDGLLERSKQRQREVPLGAAASFMTITFLGFYHRDPPQDQVKVETFLVKVSHKRRKDVSSPVMQVSVGVSEVPTNPSEEQPPTKAPTVSIPTESFRLSNGHLVKSYVLLLRVSCACQAAGTLQSSEGDSEPAQKRRKAAGWRSAEERLYGSELVVYDKHRRCLLADGEYELVLGEMQGSVRYSPKKHSSWETIGQIDEECGPFEVFSQRPTLKFRLTWSAESISGMVDRPRPITLLDSVNDSSNKENRPERCNTNCPAMMAANPSVCSSGSSNTSSGAVRCEEGSGVAAPLPRPQIVYQFLYNNNSRQQTESLVDMHCPWCSLDCVSLYALLKHLKLCHPRFSFTYVPIAQGARIDVALNECYDGSYSGSPHDLISQPPGFAFSRDGPMRRTVVSNILVCRPKRPKPSLSEFLELDESEFDGQRPYMVGHNRLYHHTTTCLPIYPKEMDVDSEGEHDPKWLQTKTMMMIDEFLDVNEGEKELMKMWNLHIMKHGFVGDCQIPLACTLFLESKGQELLRRNLYRNFLVHMCSLFDFGLISPLEIYNIFQKVQDMTSSDEETRRVLCTSWEVQRSRWVAQEKLGPPAERRKPQAKAPAPEPRRKALAGAVQNVRKGDAPPRRKSTGHSPASPACPEALPPRRKSLSLTTAQADTHRRKAGHLDGSTAKSTS